MATLKNNISEQMIEELSEVQKDLSKAYKAADITPDEYLDKMNIINDILLKIAQHT